MCKNINFHFLEKNEILDKKKLLIYFHKKLEITNDELLLIMFILYKSDLNSFIDYNEISSISNFSNDEIDNIIESLTKKNFLKIKYNEELNGLKIDFSLLFLEINKIILNNNNNSNIEKNINEIKSSNDEKINFDWWFI